MFAAHPKIDKFTPIICIADKLVVLRFFLSTRCCPLVIGLFFIALFFQAGISLSDWVIPLNPVRPENTRGEDDAECEMSEVRLYQVKG
jgi:hypothetical protein